ncbi:hypothetical protein TNCV_2743241 [Trichonephila clavipes]|nr:hypothetical protein TNCV_2743241 [Trichonephila clavipes]
MALSDSLPQINLDVQGGTQGGSNKSFTGTVLPNWYVCYLYKLIPTSREDDRFGVIGKVLAFVRNGRYPERTFLPSLETLAVL